MLLPLNFTSTCASLPSSLRLTLEAIVQAPTEALLKGKYLAWLESSKGGHKPPLQQS